MAGHCLNAKFAMWGISSRESKTEDRFFGCTRHTDCSHTLRLPEKDSNNAAGLQ